MLTAGLLPRVGRVILILRANVQSHGDLAARFVSLTRLTGAVHDTAFVMHDHLHSSASGPGAFASSLYKSNCAAWNVETPAYYRSGLQANHLDNRRPHLGETAGTRQYRIMRQILNTVIALAVVAAGAASMGYLLFGAAGYKGWMVCFRVRVHRRPSVVVCRYDRPTTEQGRRLIDKLPGGPRVLWNSREFRAYPHENWPCTFDTGYRRCMHQIGKAAAPDRVKLRSHGCGAASRVSNVIRPVGCPKVAPKRKD